MADEFQLGSGHWWDSSSSRNRFDSSAGSSTPASTSLSSMGGVSYGWPTDIVDIKAARSCIDSSVSAGSSNIIFHPDDSQKLQPHESSSSSAGLLPDPNLQMMGLTLSSQTMDWNQALFRGEKAESSSFRSMLQEESSGSFQQESGVTSSQDQWRHKFYAASPEESSITDFKPINRGLSLDQPQFSSNMDSSSYGVQGLFTDNHEQQQQQSMNYPYPSSYGVNPNDQLMNSWPKFPQFLRNSPPKHPPQGQLHFSNNTPFWNASSADVRSSLFPSLQTQLPIQNFEEKPKNTSEIREIAIGKKSNSEPPNKRPRNETPAPMPAFKVRKEKMGDRITALQQLVSPFGKTDTASVLSEAIEYIKFLHEQINALSTPYMKNVAPTQHPQNPDKSKDPEGPKQDLRGRGLCLVPVSSTFPVTNETMVEFWTPTFGGTFR